MEDTVFVPFVGVAEFLAGITRDDENKWLAAWRENAALPLQWRRCSPLMVKFASTVDTTLLKDASNLSRRPRCAQICAGRRAR
jgi:hypothetical protein